MLATLIFKNYLLSKRSGALVRIIAWHCIIGVGMGVAALIIVLSVMNGFNLVIRGRMLSVEPHLVVATKERPSLESLAKISEQLGSMSRVESIDRYESQDLILRSVDGVFGGAIAKGYDRESLDALLKRAWGSSPRATPEPFTESSRLEPDEVIIGIDLARGLGIFEGDEVLLVPPETLLLPKGEVPRLQKFRVKSLVSTQSGDIDSKFLFYQFNAKGRRIKSLSLDSGFELRLKDPYMADQVKARLQTLGFKAQTWMERDTSLFYSLKMESYAMALFLTLAVLITSFSIVTVMVLLMQQKRKDIGLFRALGLSLYRTRMVFFRVGMLLSFVGIFSGAVLGATVCWVLDKYPVELLPDIYTDSTLPAKLTLNIFIFVMATSGAIALIGAWLPVRRYVVRDPSDNLRKRAGVNV